MEKHYALSDREFEKQFAQCDLDPRLFSHTAHLRLAWIHLKRYGPEQAEKNITDQLKRYVAFIGQKDKYNATLTIAAVKMVYHFMCKSTSKTFRDFILEFPKLKSDFKKRIACHYTMDIFNSEVAKRRYLEPDILPF